MDSGRALPDSPLPTALVRCSSSAKLQESVYKSTASNNVDLCRMVATRCRLDTTVADCFASPIIRLRYCHGRTGRDFTPPRVQSV